MAMQSKFWLVFERDEAGTDHLVGARLSLETARALCKVRPNRYHRKVWATKDAGASQFDFF